MGKMEKGKKGKEIGNKMRRETLKNRIVREITGYPAKYEG